MLYENSKFKSLMDKQVPQTTASNFIKGKETNDLQNLKSGMDLLGGAHPPRQERALWGCKFGYHCHILNFSDKHPL